MTRKLASRRCCGRTSRCSARSGSNISKPAIACASIISPGPRPNIELPFPFHWFGVEVKKSCEDGSLYNDAIEQAIDYTHCAVDDPRPLLAAINGQRIARVYVFPARGGPHCWLRDDSGCNIGYCVNRLAGKFHVGMIYESRDDPLFFLQC